jgi:hypothetical protein
MYGYKKEKGKLIIDEAQAPMIRTIFDLYATGDWSTPKLEKLLHEQGYTNNNGKPISRNNIRSIIVNPKYKGYYCGNKVKIVDMFTKKQQFLTEDEWELYQDHDKVPPIIDEDTWEKANRVMTSRSNSMKGQNRAGFKGNLFTGKIICATHETPFYLKSRKIRGKEDETWVCSHRIKNGKESCGTFGIKESELKIIVCNVLDGLSSSMDNIIDRYLEYLKQANTTTTSKDTINTLQKEIDNILAKKDKLLDLSLDGSLSNAEFSKRNNTLNIELAEKEKELATLERTTFDTEQATSGILRFKKELLSYYNSETKELTTGIINTLIDKIIVHDKSNSEMHPQLILNTGTSINAPYTKSRYVNMNKKMIEAQARQMAGK